MRIGIDVDGVLANFFSAYENLCVEVAGKDLFPVRYPQALPPVWNWPEHYGYSNEVVSKVWKRIKVDGTFWQSLGPLPDTVKFLAYLDMRTGAADQVYFITDRPGRWAQDQTSIWLKQMGWVHPSVIISGPHARKGQICQGLAIDFYLDDKGENIEDVSEISKHTKAVLLAYPYNTAFQGTFHTIQRVDEFLDLLPRGT